jgi:hypothetical protein
MRSGPAVFPPSGSSEKGRVPHILERPEARLALANQGVIVIVRKTHIKRLLHPLSGSTESIELNGTVTVRKVWDGRAQLEEIEPDSHHFEESYSADGGKTWAPAFIANLTREHSPPP